jgi:hypothetical protein
LELLPVQLQALALPGPLGQVPACLARLQQLTQLQLGEEPGMLELPGWMSVLLRLEVLSIVGTGVTTPQPVLGQLPLLRAVELPVGADKELVCVHAPHLCYV